MALNEFVQQKKIQRQIMTSMSRHLLLLSDKEVTCSWLTSRNALNTLMWWYLRWNLNELSSIFSSFFILISKLTHCVIFLCELFNLMQHACACRLKHDIVLSSPSDRPSVCFSYSRIVSKRTHLSSDFFYHLIRLWLQFLSAYAVYNSKLNTPSCTT